MKKQFFSDRSYSLKSVHGTHLSVSPDGEVSLKKRVIDDEMFSLEQWIGPIYNQDYEKQTNITDPPRQPEKASGSSEDVKAGTVIVGLIVAFIAIACICVCCCNNPSDEKVR